MGWRFRRSKKILPGVRLNFNKNSTSISFGGRGARYTVSSTGKKTASVGIPGTGLSYSTTVGNKSQNEKPRKTARMIECSKCGTTIEESSAVCEHCKSNILLVGGGQFVELWPLIIVLWSAAMALNMLLYGTWKLFYIFAAVAALFAIVLILVLILRPKIGDHAIVKIKWRLRLWYVLPLWFAMQLINAVIEVANYL